MERSHDKTNQHQTIWHCMALQQCILDNYANRMQYSGLDSNYFVPSAVNNMLHHIPTMTKPQNCENITCLAGPYWIDIPSHLCTCLYVWKYVLLNRYRVAIHVVRIFHDKQRGVHIAPLLMNEAHLHPCIWFAGLLAQLIICNCKCYLRYLFKGT